MSYKWSIAQFLVAGNGAPSGGCSCTLSYSETVNSAGAVNNFSGQKWTDTVSHSLCQVDFLTTAHGIISDRTFTAYVYSMTGADLNAVIGTSNSITGDNSWSSTWVSFTFSPNITLAANTDYAIVFTSSPFDGTFTNYGDSFFHSASTIPGYMDTWSSGGTSDGLGGLGYTRDIKIYFCI